MSKKADGNTSDESNSGGATLKAKLPKFSNFDLNGSAGNSMETPRRFRDGELINSLNSILSEVRKFLTIIFDPIYSMPEYQLFWKWLRESPNLLVNQN